MGGTRWLDRNIVVVLICLIVAIGLIAAGVFDPRPIGTVQVLVEGEMISAENPAGNVQWFATVPAASFSVRSRLTMELATDYHETPQAYALVVGEPDRWQAIAIDPTSGFLSRYWVESGTQRIIEPWRTWAHVEMHPTHELWVDVVDGQLNLRINREQYPDAVDLQCDPCQVGVWTNHTVRIGQLAILYE